MKKLESWLTAQWHFKTRSRGTGYSCPSHAFYLNGELFHEDLDFPEQDFMRSCVKEQMFQLHSLPHRKLWKCGTKCFYLMIRSSTFR